MLLAGDVGGTKTVVALFERTERSDGATSGLRRVAESTHPSGEHESFEEIVRGFLGDAGHPTLSAACVGVAGPVIGGVVRVTNLPWCVDEGELAREVGTPRVKLLNDLEATAFGMLFLEEERFAVLNPGDAPDQRGNIAVIAAGTGLGEACLYWDGQDYQPIATEGGHSSYAPRNEREIALLRHLQREHGDHVSAERVISGMAFSGIYRFLRQESGEPEPEWLTRRIDAGDPSAAVAEVGVAGEDPVCAETVALFVSNYGAEAGNMALRYLALGGVWLGGGIAPKLLPALQDGNFMEAFCNKGRFSELLRGLPVKVALDPETALMGSAHYAKRLAER